MLAIAFEGCACRAAFHAGVAAAFAERALPIALTAGASSGSLIAVGLAAGRGAELPAIWRALGGRRIVSLRRLVQNRSPFDMSHLVRTTLEAALGGAPADLRHHAVEALVTATRIRDLGRVVFSTREEPDMLPPLLASCFFPLLYGRTVRVRGQLLVDGGLVDNLPLEPLVDRGAREIIAVTTRPDGTALKNPWRRRWRPQLERTRTGAASNGAPNHVAASNGAPSHVAPRNGAASHVAPRNGAASHVAASNGAASRVAASSGAAGDGVTRDGAASHVAPSNGSAGHGVARDGAASRGAPHDSAASTRVHVIHPRAPLAIRSWDFSPDAIARAIDDGYEAARRFLG
jgi:NTE family protein